MKVKIINKPVYELPENESYLPEYETSGSAGFDIRANITEPINLMPGETRLIKTGLFMAIPEGYELQIRPRSGMALKHGITVLNTPGTIDSDYRLEIGVILINHSRTIFTVEPAMRIAQGVFSKYERAEWEEVNELDVTERKGGFGSTGVK